MTITDSKQRAVGRTQNVHPRQIQKLPGLKIKRRSHMGATVDVGIDAVALSDRHNADFTRITLNGESGGIAVHDVVQCTERPGSRVSQREEPFSMVPP